MPLNPLISNWQGRVVWLVGASSGIGAATASLLHQHGAKVRVSARSGELLADWVRAHPGSVAYAMDVTDAVAVQAVARTIEAADGPIDLMLYCAGHYAPQHATSLSVAQARQHMEVNYMGAVHAVAAVLPAMLSRRAGHLALISSVAGYRGLPKALAYGPTKAALQNWADVLYLDLHPHGLGVSIINPGFVQTPLTASNDFAMPALLTPEQAAQHIVKGLARGLYEIHFPKRFTFWLKLLSLLGHHAYFAVTRRLSR